RPAEGGAPGRPRGARRAVPTSCLRNHHARGVVPSRVPRSRVRVLRRAEAMSFDDAYTGILTRLSPIPRRAGRPDVPPWGGVAPPWGPRGVDLALGGAGWENDDARDACVGEAIERIQAYPLPADELVDASFARWTRDEPAIEPERWTLFHADQYRSPGFP